MNAVTADEYLRWSKSHYENFTVVSWLLPRRLRRPVRLLYAYCRYVDDLGDEAPGDRLTLLAEFQNDLERCYSDQPRHPLLRAFQPVIQEFDLPYEPLAALIEANRMDQTIHRYPTYQDLLWYCAHSANPVGRLFLALLGENDPEKVDLSDATCTALQLVNILQDISEDYRRGRIYLPAREMEQFGVSEAMIAAEQDTPELQALITFQCQRVHTLFMKGLPLATQLEGMAKVDVRLFTYGGLAVLDGFRRNGYKVFSGKPTVGKAKKALLLLRTLAWLCTASRRPA